MYQVFKNLTLRYSWTSLHFMSFVPLERTMRSARKVIFGTWWILTWPFVPLYFLRHVSHRLQRDLPALTLVPQSIIICQYKVPRNFFKPAAAMVYMRPGSSTL